MSHTILSGKLHLFTKHLESEGDVRELEESYRLRYEIYCLEAGFLDKGLYTSGIESDAYDAVSEHFTAVNHDNGRVVGTVRLVKHSDRLGFPTAEHYPKLYNLLEAKGIDVKEACEISRLCITKDFRRRLVPRDGLYGVESYIEDEDPTRKYPVILLHLFRKMYLFSKQNGITHWFASMEEILYRALNRFSLKFHPLGDDVIEYYGTVRMYYALISDLEERLSSARPELYEFFCCSK